jgi:SPP1 gp7 family putative phage head morphogenesis protein
VRIQGPSLADNRRAGDRFAELVMHHVNASVKAAARTLDGTPTPDDLAPLRRHWESRVDGELLMALRREWFREANATLRNLEDAATKADEALTASAVEILPVRDLLAEEYLASARNRLVAVGDETWQHARDQMLIGLREGESIKQIQNRVTSATELARPRAEVIARTEVIGASNRGAIEQMYAAGLPATKEWIATNDSRTRPTHHAVDGKKVGLKEDFMVGGASMDGPHDPKGPAKETVSCRCTLGFEIGEEDLVEEDLASEVLQAETLTEDQYAMLAPGRKHALSSIEKILGQTRQGKNTFEVIKSFTEKRGGVTRLRQLLESALSGDELSLAQRVKAEDFLAALNGYNLSAVPQLYRGIGIKPVIKSTENDWFDAFEAQYKIGTKVDLPISSFTSSSRKAEEFMRSPGGGTTGRSGLVQMKIIVDGQTHALPVENMSKFAAEKEWLAGGRFEVTRFDPPTGKRGYYEMHVKQIDTLHLPKRSES